MEKRHPKRTGVTHANDCFQEAPVLTAKNNGWGEPICATVHDY